MKPFVDLEGSGEGITKIRGTAESTPGSPGGVVRFTTGNAELRFLTVENNGPPLFPPPGRVAVLCVSPAMATIQHVTAQAPNGIGVVVSGTLRLENATVSGVVGLVVDLTAFVHRSRIIGSVALIISGTARVGASQIEGSVDAGSFAVLKCVASYNANFDPLGANCQLLP